MGTGAASVSCPATGAACALVPPAAAACGTAAATAIAVCSVASGGSSAQVRVHGNSADSMMGTEVYYLINRLTGVIDKIGITSYPTTRYSKSYFDLENVRYETQSRYEWRTMAIIDEQIRLMNYFVANGNLPRLNRTFR
jgi:hypothetical protein